MAAHFRDINGRNIFFEQQHHSPLCREFTVISPKLSLRSVLGYTAFIWLVAYSIFYTTQNTSVLSATIIITLLGMILHLHFCKVDQESMLIIGSIGVQMNTLYASGREHVNFIEMKKVKDIVINEGFYMKVIYYLCILLIDTESPRGVSEVVPVFQSAKPRLDCLSQVYRSCQEILQQTQVEQ
ncbi:phosphatidylinositol N-acetylglucosaminyltransferase subunit H isoform X2 [Amblyraja radiata]|uniref:phosphatidylinositol N-acetylglucosaminyltransferase subunit H isoform X2 n=1 Tax=Amblyraja radiata TaxID=386614 RepID=UPI00140374BB|nr:phosphatidylinositol N-acetylglucosaminyltransferase subunit H isoform X2 [Amblyraja radiata]XP_055496955.1 phosphatidylinositol N-acetylglucosaminyltransferase subunit H isoform X2 [Leucoraja erinacea]